MRNAALSLCALLTATTTGCISMVETQTRRVLESEMTSRVVERIADAGGWATAEVRSDRLIVSVARDSGRCTFEEVAIEHVETQITTQPRAPAWRPGGLAWTLSLVVGVAASAGGAGMLAVAAQEPGASARSRGLYGGGATLASLGVASLVPALYVLGASRSSAPQRNREERVVRRFERPCEATARSHRAIALHQGGQRTVLVTDASGQIVLDSRQVAWLGIGSGPLTLADPDSRRALATIEVPPLPPPDVAPPAAVIELTEVVATPERAVDVRRVSTGLDALPVQRMSPSRSYLAALRIGAVDGLMEVEARLLDPETGTTPALGSATAWSHPSREAVAVAATLLLDRLRLAVAQPSEPRP